MNPRVYLAGPIAGLTYDESTGWRNGVADALRLRGIDSYCPMRAKNFLKKVGRLDQDFIEANGFSSNPMVNDKGIVTRDRNDVFTSDLVFMNLAGAKTVSIGTMCELAWADAYRKPVVLVMEPGNIHDHPFVRQLAGFQTANLNTAIDMTCAILLRQFESSRLEFAQERVA